MNHYKIKKIGAYVNILIVLYFLPPIFSILFSAFLLIRVAFFLIPIKGKAIPKYENPLQALVVMDMQENLLGEEGTYKDSQKLIASVNYAISQAKQQGKPIIYVRQEFKLSDSVFSYITMGGRLTAGEEGSGFVSNLHLVGEQSFKKHQQDAFSSKEFRSFLENNQINFLTLVGVDAAACVYKTAISAFSRGYGVEVIQDAVATSLPKGLGGIFENYSEKGITLVKGV